MNNLILFLHSLLDNVEHCAEVTQLGVTTYDAGVCDPLVARR